MLRVRLSRLVAFVARAKARRANEAATLIQEARAHAMVLARRCGESTIVVQSTHAASYEDRGWRVHHAGALVSLRRRRPSGWTRRQPRLALIIGEFGTKSGRRASPSLLYN